MNEKDEANAEKSAGPLSDQEFLEWVMRYQDATLTASELQQFSEMLQNDPARRLQFRRIQLRTAKLHNLLRMDAFSRSGTLLGEQRESSSADHRFESNSRQSRFRKRFQRMAWRWSGVIALALLLICGWSLWNRNIPPEPGIADVDSFHDERPVLLVEEN